MFAAIVIGFASKDAAEQYADDCLRKGQIHGIKRVQVEELPDDAPNPAEVDDISAAAPTPLEKPSKAGLTALGDLSAAQKQAISDAGQTQPTK